ncbi:MAG TPA: DNA-3-methyladenine glycosylase I [Gammaproteobacteria bacterium]|nr:DNA-3-methyladenine glycosylase I [Gammaproteobacteria bacterium]
MNTTYSRNGKIDIERCDWASPNDPVYVAYHDDEWGVPVHDDRTLFEFLLLEGAQAGLSWATILRRRAGYRTAFADFDPAKVARLDRRRIEALLQNPAIIRNRLKVESAVTNARAFLTIQEAHGSFDAFLWRYVDGRPVQNAWPRHADVPPRTALSDVLSKDLKKLGFKFVGSTICYSLMQAVGLVNDHVTSCFRHRELAGR